MVRTTLTALTVLAVGALAACGSSSTTTSPTPTPAVPVATPTVAPTTAPTATATATSSPTSIDPCALVTSAEASQLGGATFGPGVEKTYTGTGRGCVYGSNTLNVFTVIVAVATDAATASADWASEEAKLKSVLEFERRAGNNINLPISDVSDVSGADMAAAGAGTETVGGMKLGVSAIFVLKGAVFFTFSDLALGKPAATVADMETQAETALGRLP